MGANAPVVALLARKAVYQAAGAERLSRVADVRVNIFLLVFYNEMI